MTLLWAIHASPVEVALSHQEDWLTSSAMKLSFALPSSKQTKQTVGAAPSLKRPAAFSSVEDDDPMDAASTLGSDNKTAPNKKLLAQNVVFSKATLKRMEVEKRVDQTVYEYDEVWDKMQLVKLKQKEAKESENRERKVGLPTHR
jgi:hypothetical protein